MLIYLHSIYFVVSFSFTRMWDVFWYDKILLGYNTTLNTRNEQKTFSFLYDLQNRKLATIGVSMVIQYSVAYFWFFLNFIIKSFLMFADEVHFLLYHGIIYFIINNKIHQFSFHTSQHFHTSINQIKKIIIERFQPTTKKWQNNIHIAN